MCNGVCVSVITGPWGSCGGLNWPAGSRFKELGRTMQGVHMHRQEHLRRGVCLRQITGYTWRYVWEHSHPQTRPLEYRSEVNKLKKHDCWGYFHTSTPHTQAHTHTPRPTHAHTPRPTQPPTRTHTRTHTDRQREITLFPCFIIVLEVTSSGDFTCPMLSQCVLINSLGKN